MKYGITAVAGIVAFAGAQSFAQTSPMCAQASQSAGWPHELDAVQAAPKNHRVIFENEDIRVLEVTVQPGERENRHHHRWPSIMVVDGLPKYVNYDKNGNEIRPAVPSSGKADLPLVARLPAQETHYIENLGDKPFHAIRVEYKRKCRAR